MTWPGRDTGHAPSVQGATEFLDDQLEGHEMATEVKVPEPAPGGALDVIQVETRKEDPQASATAAGTQPPAPIRWQRREVKRIASRKLAGQAAPDKEVLAAAIAARPFKPFLLPILIALMIRATKVGQKFSYRLKELAENVGTTPTTAVQALHVLEADGLVIIDAFPSEEEVGVFRLQTADGLAAVLKAKVDAKKEALDLEAAERAEEDAESEQTEIGKEA